MANIIESEAEPTLNYSAYPFSKPHFDFRYSEGVFCKILSSTSCHGAKSLKFVLKGQRGPFVWDLSQIIMAASVQLLNSKKTGPPKKGLKASVANNLLFSMIKSINISFDNKSVCSINDYNYLNYIQTRLTLNENQCGTYCYIAGYASDTNYDQNNINNLGWKRRLEPFGKYVKEAGESTSKFLYGSGTVFYVGLLGHWLPAQAYLPGNCDITLDMELVSDDFLILSDTQDDTDITYSLENCEIFVPRYKINDRVFLDLESKLQHSPMRQFFVKSELLNFSIPKGVRSHIIDTISIARTPSKIYCVFLETERYQGSKLLNPYKMSMKFGQGADTFMISDVRCTLSNMPIDNLIMHDKTFKEHYFKLFHLNAMNDRGNNTCSITYPDFVDNTCILTWDCSSSLGTTPDYLLPVVRTGPVRLEIDFSESTTCSLTALIIVEQVVSMTIDAKGGAKIDAT